MLFAGQDIDKSPYAVNVAKDMGDPSKVHARGPGLERTGNVANKPTYFDIYTAGENVNGNRFPTCRREPEEFQLFFRSIEYRQTTVTARSAADEAFFPTTRCRQRRRQRGDC